MRIICRVLAYPDEGADFIGDVYLINLQSFHRHHAYLLRRLSLKVEFVGMAVLPDVSSNRPRLADSSIPEQFDVVKLPIDNAIVVFGQHCQRPCLRKDVIWIA